MKKITSWRGQLCAILFLCIASVNSISAQINPTDDFDGDGIINSIDIDDDNDGVLDTVECSTAYPTTPPSANTKEFFLYVNSGNRSAGSVETANIASASDWVPGGGLTAESYYSVFTNFFRVLNVDATDLNTAMVNNEYVQYGFTTTSKTAGIIYYAMTYYRSTNFHWAVVISDDNFATYKILNPDINQVSGTAVDKSHDLDDYRLKPNTTYQLRTYFWGRSSIDFDDFRIFGYNECDIDGDGIPNRVDLDSDGDGCPDAVEAGVADKVGAANTSTGTIVNTSANGGTQNNIPKARIGNATANYGTNGFYSGIESGDTSTANYTGTYTYNQYAIDITKNFCKDTDNDNTPDLIDIDDDNDGILDKVECPAGFVNLVNGGGFTTDPPTPNWYFANSTSNYDTPFTGYPYGYGGTQTNSTNTGGLFDEVDGNNTNTAGFNALIEVNGTTDALVSRLNQPLVAGATYQFSYDAGLRGSAGVSGQNCTLQLYNADTNTVQSVLSSIPLNSLPAYPNYQTISGSFTVPTSGNYYLLFMNAGDGGAGNDYIIDRVAAIGKLGSTPSVCDLDGDGVPNYLDLDTDGDGCSDLSESGVSPSTDISTPSSTFNNNGGSYGIAPDKLTGSQLNPAATDANNDGLNDSVDSDTNGEPNYASTYTWYALSSAIAACVDSDSDGVVDLIDIDDDNDGILDAVESPNCFYKESEATKVISVTTQLNPYSTSTNGIGNSYDNDTTTYSQFANAQNWVGKSIVEITPETPLAITSVNFLMGVNSLSSNATSTFKLQGWNGNMWVDLSAAMSSASTADFSINNTLHVGTAYSKYRLVGVAGTCQYGGIKEITLTAYQYSSSSHPKSTCNNDPDGDSVMNHLDLDSDGDGCPDAVEAGVVNKVGDSNTSTGTIVNTPANGGNQNNVPKAVIGNSTTNYGTNGFYPGIESNDTFTANYTGTYTYNKYAIVSTINACTDTDGDNVADVFDIDDDNDGVLDTVECPAAFTNIVSGGGFTTDPPSSNWYKVAIVPTPNYETPNGNLNNSNHGNSTLTGGLFGEIDNQNGNTGALSILVNDPDRPVVSKLSEKLIAGVPYDFSIDLGGRSANGNTAKSYVVQLYNADTHALANIIATDFLSTLPGPNSDTNPSSNYKTVSGSFTVNTTGNYYLVIATTGTGGIADDFVFDRVAVKGHALPQICDLDNDGIPNYLDLDSDGDGCPDTKEAILYNFSTEASISGNVQNGSGGAVTSTVSTPNAMVPGPYGSNGFADALQSGSNPDAYKHVYTYEFVATAANISACDNKFILDMDSDDDGIPDAVESPSCFYTEAQAMDITERVTSDFGWAAANPLSNTYDDNTATTNYGAVDASATSILNKALITFDLPVIDAALIDNVKLTVGGVTFGTGKWRLQGLDMDTNTWVYLSDTAGMAMNAVSTYTFSNTLQPTKRYHSYRIIGIDNVNITNTARLIEFTIHYKNYNPSFHRTKMGCSSDTDGDGVPNYVDRDSDGDGCPDAIEAGISKSLLLPANFYNVGGQVSGTHVIVGGNYSNNGMSDDVETTSDSGIINYASTYNQYAQYSNINFCTDTDNDSIPDVIDIDDDNDGVLDAVESPACFYTASEAIVPVKISTGITTSTVNSVAVTPGNDIPTMHDSATSSVNASNHVVSANQLGTTSVVIYKIEYPTNVGLTQVLINGNGVSWGTGSFAVLEGSNDDTVYEAVSDPLATSSTSATKTWLVNNSLPTATNLYKYYRIRVSTVGSTQPVFTNYEVTGTLKTTTYAPSAHPKSGTCIVDSDTDGIFNHLDNDSDNDGCSDASEAGTAAYSSANGGTSSSGTLNNPSSSISSSATVGTNAPADYGANGFYNVLEASGNGVYQGTYTYANAISSSINNCNTVCYKSATTAGTVLDAKQGITSLQRAGADENDRWPMVRKGAWTVLEAKTKGFVPNRLTAAQINDIPEADLVEGMMVYNISLECLYINTNGTVNGWKCFNTQTCP